MPETDLAILILAAGKGTRMRSHQPKCLHKLAGLPMLGHVVAVADSLSPARLLIVTPPDNKAVSTLAPQAELVVQDPPKGTGDAVIQARQALKGFQGNLLILYADAPLLRQQTLHRFLATWQADSPPKQADMAILGIRLEPPNAYGRIITDTEGNPSAIIEAADAGPAQKQLTLCHSGILGARAPIFFDILDHLSANNAQNEIYLTDTLKLMVKNGATVKLHEDDPEDVMGINTQSELAKAEHILQNRLREDAMDRGVTLIDPQTVWFSYDTWLAPGCVVGPNVVFEPGVKVGERATIRAFCHISHTQIAAGAVIGPFARLRPGTTIGEAAHIGNFVEVKNTRVETGAKINHLSYIGDAHIGATTNIGAGVITCNYDGSQKYHTSIGKNAFIGSNTALIAPLDLGDGVTIGAGSVISDPVDSHSLALTRPALTQKPNWKRNPSQDKIPARARQDSPKTRSKPGKITRKKRDKQQ